MNFQTLRLKDTCLKITDGTHHSPPIVAEGVPYVTAKHIKPSGIRFFDDPWFVSDDSHAKIYSRCDPRPGDVLYIKDGVTTGIAAVNEYEFPFSMLSSVALLRPDPNLCDAKFLASWLNSPPTRDKYLKRMGGAAIKRLTLTKIKEFQIPLPPLPEQKRIAGILDAADALRAKRRESLAQLDTLLQSTFLDMFGDPVTNPMGWEMGRLSDIVDRLDGGKNVAQSETETDYRVLKVSAVTSGEYRPEESKYLPAEFDVPESYLVNKGDLLISRANTVELVGATAYVWETPRNIALPDKIWKFIWKENAEIEPLFVYYLSRDAEFHRILSSRASGTSGSMKNIAKPKLLGLPIPLPPIQLQQHFAAIVETAAQQKTRQRAHLAELDTLFASLQSRAFQGDL